MKKKLSKADLKEQRRKTRRRVPLGAGFFANVTADRRNMSLECTQLPLLREALGTDVLASFVAAFAGIERMTACIDLMEVSESIRKTRNAAFQRNHRVLFFFVFSLHNEIWKAVEDLPKKVPALLGPTPFRAWDVLHDLIEAWRPRLIMKKVRGTLGFHLGEDELPKGLASFKAGESVVIFRNVTENVKDVYFPIADIAIERGAGFQGNDKLRTVVEQAVNDVQRFRDSIQAVFFELARRRLNLKMPPSQWEE